MMSQLASSRGLEQEDNAESLSPSAASMLLGHLLQGLSEDQKEVAAAVLKQCLIAFGLASPEKPSFAVDEESKSVVATRKPIACSPVVRFSESDSSRRTRRPPCKPSLIVPGSGLEGAGESGSGATLSAGEIQEGEEKKFQDVSLYRDLLLSTAAALRHHISLASRGAADPISQAPCCSSCSSPSCRREGNSPSSFMQLPPLCGCTCPTAVARASEEALAGAASTSGRISSSSQALQHAFAAATAAVAAAGTAEDFDGAVATMASNLVCAAVRAQLQGAAHDAPSQPTADPEMTLGSKRLLAKVISSLYCRRRSICAQPKRVEGQNPVGPSGEDGRIRKKIGRHRTFKEVLCAADADKGHSDDGNDPDQSEESHPLPLPPATLRVLLNHAEQSRDEELLVLLLAIAQQPVLPRSAAASPNRGTAHARIGSDKEGKAEAVPQQLDSRQRIRAASTVSDSSAIVIRGAAKASWRSFCLGRSALQNGKHTLAESSDGTGETRRLSSICASTQTREKEPGSGRTDAGPVKIIAPGTDAGSEDDDVNSIAATRTSTMNDGSAGVPVCTGTCSGATANPEWIDTDSVFTVAATVVSRDPGGGGCTGGRGSFKSSPAVATFSKEPVAVEAAVRGRLDTNRLPPRATTTAAAGASAAGIEQVLVSLGSEGGSTTSCCSPVPSSASASDFGCVCARPNCPLCCPAPGDVRKSDAATNTTGTVFHTRAADELADAAELCHAKSGAALAGSSAACRERLRVERHGSAEEDRPTTSQAAEARGPETGLNEEETVDHTWETLEQNELMAAAAVLKTFISLRRSAKASGPLGLLAADAEKGGDLVERFVRLVEACGAKQTGTKELSQAVADIIGGCGVGKKSVPSSDQVPPPAPEVTTDKREGPVSEGAELEADKGDDLSKRGRQSALTAGIAKPAEPAEENFTEQGQPPDEVPRPEDSQRRKLDQKLSQVARQHSPKTTSVPIEGGQSRTGLGTLPGDKAGGGDDIAETPPPAEAKGVELKEGGLWEERGEGEVYRYGVLLRQLGRSGKVRACWAVWSKLKNTRGLQPNAVAYGCMYDALVSNGRVVEALELFEEMKREGAIQPNTIMYSTIIKGFAQGKQLDRALSMYAEMQRNGVAINTVTFNSIVDACARVGAMDKAAMLLEDMLSQGVKPDLITFSTIIKGYCVHGEMNKALHLLGAMRERNIKPDGVLYNSLLDGCVKTGRVALCEYLWEEMQREGIPPSNFTLTILIKMHGRMYQLQKAFDLVKELPRKYGFRINAHVYTCLMAACIVNKEYSLALEVYECMDRDGVRGDPKTLSTIVGGCVKGRLFREAAEILDRALDKMSTGSTNCCSQPGAHENFGHGGEGGAEKHPATVDEKTLRFVVHQFKAQGLGEDLGLPLVQKAIRVGLLRGRSAAAALHSFTHQPTPVRQDSKMYPPPPPPSCSQTSARSGNPGLSVPEWTVDPLPASKRIVPHPSCGAGEHTGVGNMCPPAGVHLNNGWETHFWHMRAEDRGFQPCLEGTQRRKSFFRGRTERETNSPGSSRPSSLNSSAADPNVAPVPCAGGAGGRLVHRQVGCLGAERCTAAKSSGDLQQVLGFVPEPRTCALPGVHCLTKPSLGLQYRPQDAHFKEVLPGPVGGVSTGRLVAPETARWMHASVSPRDEAAASHVPEYAEKACGKQRHLSQPPPPPPPPPPCDSRTGVPTFRSDGEGIGFPNVCGNSEHVTNPLDRCRLGRLVAGEGYTEPEGEFGAQYGNSQGGRGQSWGQTEAAREGGAQVSSENARGKQRCFNMHHSFVLAGGRNEVPLAELPKHAREPEDSQQAVIGSAGCSGLPPDAADMVDPRFRGDRTQHRENADCWSEGFPVSGGVSAFRNCKPSGHRLPTLLSMRLPVTAGSPELSSVSTARAGEHGPISFLPAVAFSAGAGGGGDERQNWSSVSSEARTARQRCPGKRGCALFAKETEGAQACWGYESPVNHAQPTPPPTFPPSASSTRDLRGALAGGEVGSSRGAQYPESRFLCLAGEDRGSEGGAVFQLKQGARESNAPMLMGEKTGHDAFFASGCASSTDYREMKSKEFPSDSMVAARCFETFLDGSERTAARRIGVEAPSEGEANEQNACTGTGAGFLDNFVPTGGSQTRAAVKGTVKTVPETGDIATESGRSPEMEMQKACTGAAGGTVRERGQLGGSVQQKTPGYFVQPPPPPPPSASGFQREGGVEESAELVDNRNRQRRQAKE